MKMYKYQKVILWGILIIMLLALIPTALIRIDNEANNKSIVPIMDYDDFYKNASIANIKFDEVLKRMMEAGVKTIAVKERSGYELQNKGLAYCDTVAKFYTDFIDISDKEKNTLDSLIHRLDGNSYSTVIYTSNGEINRMVEHALSLRYTDKYYGSMEFRNGTLHLISYYISNTSKVGLGFDEQLISELKNKGFDILLRPINSSNVKTDYIDEYQGIIQKYGIHYILPATAESIGYPRDLDKYSALINNNQLITGIIESPSQIKYVDIDGIEKIMKDTNYAINRVYSIYDSLLAKIPSDEMFNNWVRGIVDRNNRLIYIRPLMNAKHTASQNIDNTISAVSKLTEFFSDKGYELNTPIKSLSDRASGKASHTLIAISLLVGCLLYLSYLFEIKTKYLVALFIVGLLGIMLSILVVNMDLTKVFALGAALLFPSLSSLVLLRYIRSSLYNNSSFIINWLISLCIVLGVNALGMFTIISSLSHITYTMNIDMFKGVKLSFILPLIIFVLQYGILLSGKKPVSLIKRILKTNINLAALILFALAGIAFYVLVGRSGNTSGIQVSSLELKIREVLEELLLARPRFKEFVIGYPSLLILIYLYKKYKYSIIELVLGLGVLVGSISMTNSFCHVFASTEISFKRTINGLITGIPIGLLCVLCVYLLLALYNRYKDKIKGLLSNI